MIKEAIEKIERMTAPNTIELDGRVYSDKSVSLIPTPDFPSVCISSLASFVEYVKQDVDGVKNPFVVVKDHVNVALLTSPEGAGMKRSCLVKASFEKFACDFRFNTYHDVESFLISSQTCFEDTDDMVVIRRLVGNMSAEKVKTVTDDGITQQVMTKTQVGLPERQTIQNPFNLSPFRTFKDIPQPVSPFILRVQQGRDGELPRVGLWEVDSAGWKVKCMSDIAVYISNALPEMIVLV